MSDFKTKVFEKFNGRCAYCGNEITVNNMTVDHIYPKSLGGSLSMFNCNPSCTRCNTLKANGTVEELREKILNSIQELKTNKHFQMVKKYKLTEIISEEVKFYFEEILNETKNF